MPLSREQVRFLVCGRRPGVLSRCPCMGAHHLIFGVHLLSGPVAAADRWRCGGCGGAAAYAAGGLRLISPAALLLTMRMCAGGMRQARVAALIGLATVALLAMVVLAGNAASQRTVLDDVIDNPLEGMASLDDTPHEWTDAHGDGYDPEQQNILATDDDAFTVPFVGYAKKDLKWRAPAEPETNALDYLPTVCTNARPASAAAPSHSLLVELDEMTVLCLKLQRLVTLVCVRVCV